MTCTLQLRGLSATGPAGALCARQHRSRLQRDAREVLRRRRLLGERGLRDAARMLRGWPRCRAAAGCGQVLERLRRRLPVQAGEAGQRGQRAPAQHWRPRARRARRCSLAVPDRDRLADTSRSEPRAPCHAHDRGRLPRDFQSSLQRRCIRSDLDTGADHARQCTGGVRRRVHRCGKRVSEEGLPVEPVEQASAILQLTNFDTWRTCFSSLVPPAMHVADAHRRT